jgi:hypothetical protein
MIWPSLFEGGLAMVSKRLTQVSFASLLAVGLSLGACSPYVYKEEIATFRNGVKDSLQSFGALQPQYTAWATEQRNRQLLTAFNQTGAVPSTSEGCLQLRQKYELAFTESGAPAGELLSAADYAACTVTPVPRTDPNKGLPNLQALGGALNAYVAGLEAVTNAGDEAALQDAFGALNTSAKSLLATVNEELAKRSEPALEAFGSLVYQAGLTYLRQRRFDALKQAVNVNDPVVGRAADLLAEAAFDIYGPTVTDRAQALEAAERKALEADAANYVAVWSDIDKARAAYVGAIQDSPVYAFHRIKTTHGALRASLNDPTNREQLEALYENAAALKKAAEAALKVVQQDEGQ